MKFLTEWCEDSILNTLFLGLILGYRHEGKLNNYLHLTTSHIEIDSIWLDPYMITKSIKLMISIFHAYQLNRLRVKIFKRWVSRSQRFMLLCLLNLLLFVNFFVGFYFFLFMRDHCVEFSWLTCKKNPHQIESS